MGTAMLGRRDRVGGLGEQKQLDSRQVEADLQRAVAAAVVAASWLAPGGWLAVETERNSAVDPGPLTVEVERNTGRARLTLMRLA